MKRVVTTVGVYVAIIGTACTTAGTEAASGPTTVATHPVVVEGVVVPPGDSASARNQVGYVFPDGPAVDDHPASPALIGLVDELFAGVVAGTGIDADVVAGIGSAGDPRVAWPLSDLLRVIGPSFERNRIIETIQDLTGLTFYDDPVARRSLTQSIVDHLIAWDLPAPTGYERWKRQLLVAIDPRWDVLFTDVAESFDWRWLSWGGVFIDDRPLGTPTGCVRGCIPALDDPAVTDAARGGWYDDDGLVFGVVVGGEARAYPKHIMETHEMVNDDLGGRRIGIPYCTLCGSAQVYLTDSVPEAIETPVLRTSGLLSRSNKVMYDLVTGSMFDTFLGVAVSGPLAEAGVELESVSVVTSTWREWKAAHPDTTIVAQDGGIGRVYDLDPLGGRDDRGPIFPVGDVDQRLDTQTKVLGVIAPDGTPVAFPVDESRAAIDMGADVALLGVIVVPDGSGIRAELVAGGEVVGHEAFWFAWSQFHPDTVVWAAPDER